MKSLLRRALEIAAALALAVGAMPATAATWESLGCDGCHTSPPTFQATTPGNVCNASYIIGLNDLSLGNLSAFTSHVNARGTACGAPQMTNLAGSDAADIHNYLLLVRDGSIGSFAFSYPGSPGTAVGSSVDRVDSFVVSNYRGTGMAYSVSASGDFSIVGHTSSGTGCSAGFVPAATSSSPRSCTVTLTVRFSPSAPGTRNGTVSVTPATNSGVALQGRSVAVSALGYVPTPGFSRTPATLTLSARLGSNDGGVVFITNPAGATANLVLNTLTFSGTPGVFTRGGTCTTGGPGLAPNTQCTVTVTYTPTASGSQSGTLNITHNASGSPATVALNATGTESLISPVTNTVNFGNVQQGVPRVLTQQITNSGTATLNFSAPLPSAPGARSGAAAGDYTVSGCAAALAPGNSCTLTITLTPSALGARPATLTIASDATNGPAVITLAGTGVALPEPSVDPLTVADFPDTVIAQASPTLRSVTVTNDRTRDVGLTVVAPTDFEVAGGSCGAIVAGGASCTVQLRFRPGVAGGESRRTGSFTFNFTGTSGDPNPDPIVVGVAGNALFPLQLSTTTLTPSAVVGTPTTTTVVLTNRASTPLTLSSFTYGGAQGSDYSRDPTSTCTAGAALAASASCNLVTRFNPPVAGTRNGTVTIAHTGSAGSPQVVTLNGTAIPAPQGRIELSAASLVFAATQLDGTSTLSFTVRNTGDLALNFSSFNISGANAGEFTRAGTCAVGTPVPYVPGNPPAECTVTITFAPTALGVRTASLAIASDASNGTATLAMSGTGIPIPVPVVSLTPATLEFGNQTIGGLYPARRVRLSNVGTADLAVASVVVSGTGFVNASATACPAVLPVGAGCDIDIAFGATEARLYTGALTITDNAAGSPHTVVLRGTGLASAVPVLTWSPMVTTLDFGMVSAGSTSAVQTVTVLNQGPGGATLTLLNATGPDANAFSVTGGTCNLTDPLFEGASCTVNLVFSPGSAGAKTAQVQVASTGSFPTTLTLTGTGLAGPSPSFALSTPALDLGSVRVGAQSMPQVVRLTSSGTGLVTVTAMATEGPFSILSTTCPAMPFTLPAGSECTVSVAYNPSSEGTAAGTLRITSDAAPAVREVALTGNGTGNADTTDGGGGGCAIGGGQAPLDPTLWLLLLGAIALMLERERRRRRDSLRRRRLPGARGTERHDDEVTR